MRGQVSHVITLQPDHALSCWEVYLDTDILGQRQVSWCDVGVSADKEELHAGRPEVAVDGITVAVHTKLDKLS